MMQIKEFLKRNLNLECNKSIKLKRIYHSW